LVALFSIKLKRFCRASIGGAHGHENLQKEKKQETKKIWQVFRYNTMFVDGCVYPSGTFF
jgi:hypothetical protein